MPSPAEKIDIERTKKFAGRRAGLSNDLSWRPDGAVSGVERRGCADQRRVGAKDRVTRAMDSRMALRAGSGEPDRLYRGGTFRAESGKRAGFGEREQPLLSRRRILRATAADGRAQSASRIIQERHRTELRSAWSGSEPWRRAAAGAVVPYAACSERTTQARRSRWQAAKRRKSRGHRLRFRGRTDRDGEGLPPFQLPWI